VVAGLGWRVIRVSPRHVTPSATFSATWTVNSTGPITMGLVAPQGELPSGYGVQVGSFTTQTNVLNTWSDGSTRHAAVSFNATSTGAKSVVPIANPGGSYSPTFPSASAVFAVSAGAGSGSTYTATMPAYSGSWTTSLNGAVCRRAWIMVTPAAAGPTNHPNLQVIFEVTSYASGGHDVDVFVQNVQNVATMDECTYDVTVTVNGTTVLSPGTHAVEADNHRHFTGSWWHRNLWVSATEAEVQHDFAPWRRAKVIPTVVAASSVTYDFSGDNYKLGANGGSYFGEMIRDSGTNGSFSRGELQFVNAWDARLFANNTENNRLASLKNGDMSGEWTYGILETDGLTTLKVTNPTQVAYRTNHEAQTGTPGATSGLGAWTYHSSGFYWAGSRIGGNADVNPTNVNNEHMAMATFTPYLLTCKFAYYQGLKMQGAWAAMMGNPGWSEADTRFFPGLFRGRNGDQGLVSSTGVTREFGTPFKVLLRAAWGMPDGDDAQDYLIEIAQNNIDYLGYYVAYWRDNNLGGDLEAFGAGDGAAWQYFRSNSVTATTKDTPTAGWTRLTVIGDDSGVGTGVNDHNAQTGDYASLTGFVTSGATSLNNTHAQITRVDATHFDVNITTTVNTTSEGGYTFTTGMKNPPWRLWFTSYELDWASRAGLWTLNADSTEFVERSVRWAINMNAGLSDTEFITNGHSSWSYNYYPTFGYVAGDAMVWYDTMADVYAANSSAANPLSGLSTARLSDSEADYTGASSLTHRGNVTGWNDNLSATGSYNYHADVMLGIGIRRGISGASTARTRLRALTGMTTDLASMPGGYLTFDY
jgi:hypothetical protein